MADPQKQSWIDSAADQLIKLRSGEAEDNALQQSITHGLTYNPDQAAKDQANAVRLNLPLTTVQDLSEEADLAARRKEIFNKVRGTKILKTMMRDPKFAALVHDDMETLVELEKRSGPLSKTWDYIKGIGTEYAIGSALSFEGIKLQLREIFGTTTDADWWKKPSELDFRNIMETYRTGNMVREEAMPAWIKGDTERESLYSGISSFARQIPGYAMSVMNPALGLLYMGVMTESEAYLKYRERGGTRGEALTGSMLEGIIEVATEKMPMGYFVSAFGRGNFARFIGGFLARELPTEWAATAGQELVDSMIANPDKTFEDYREELPQQLYQTMIATFAHVGMAGAINLPATYIAGNYATDMDKAQAALDAAADLNWQVESTRESNLLKRAPNQMRMFLDKVLGTENAVTLSNKDATAFFQSHPEILDALPEDTRESVAESLQSGMDVSIPKADYLTSFAEVHEEIAPKLRNDIDGFTAEEAETWAVTQNIAEEAGKIFAEMDRASEFVQSAYRVRTDIEAKLTQIGEAPEIARQEAALQMEFYTATAKRAGMTPEELYKRFPVNFQRQALQGVEGLTQADTNRVAQWAGTDNIVLDASPETAPDFQTGQPVAIHGYHGTNIDFTEFDMNKLGSKNFLAESAREGIFLAGTKETAGAYIGINQGDMLGLTLTQDAGAKAIDESFRPERESLNEQRRQALRDVIAEAKETQQYKESIAKLDEVNVKLTKDLDDALVQVALGERPQVIADQRLTEAGIGQLEADLNDRVRAAYEEYINEKEGRVPHIKDLYVKMQNPYVFDYKNESDNTEGLTAHIRRAKKAGHDGVIFKNLSDGADIDTIMVAFDPSQIRSVDAAFDPDFADSGNLLAQGQGVEALNQLVYHGSPHKFIKFDHSMMGTGEGVQAYGWGTYLADNPDVARGYSVNLSRGGEVSADKIKNAVIRRTDVDKWGLFDRNGNALADHLTLFKSEDDAREFIKNADQHIANFYEVDLPDEQIEKMLDWNAPLSEQPEHVKKVFKQNSKQISKRLHIPESDILHPRATGESRYGTMRTELGGERAASEYLNSLGIPGIKYFDGNSLAAGEGTRNYVVFDENIITITKRNGEPVTQAEREQVLPESPAPLAQGPVESFEGAIGEQTLPPVEGNIPILPIGRVERELINARAQAKDGNLTGKILSKIFGAPKPRKNKEGLDSNVRPTPWKSLKKMLDWAIEKDHAGDWYKEFGGGFRELVGEANMQEASILFGITSQQNAAETNFADTLHIMALARQHNPLTNEDAFRQALREQARPDGQRIKITGSQIDRIVEAYQSGTYKGGLKVSTYMQLIKSRALNEFNPYSVQDVHMARVFGYRFRDHDKKTGNIVDAAKMPSSAAIRYGQYLTSLLAQEYNLRPDQVQAYLWFYAKSNLSPKKEGAGRKVGDGTYESAEKYAAPEIEAIEKMIDSGAFDKENALTQALETGTEPHFVSPVKKDQYTNVELNNELLDIARSRAGRAVVSANPGNARGYGFPEGTDLQTLIDYGNEVMDSITDEFGQIEFLKQAGIVHEVRQIMGTWDRVEPSFEIILPGETMETAGMVAKILGDAFLQDAAITTQPKWEGQNFAIAVRKPDGSEFTQQEIEAVYGLANPEQDPGGLNLSTSPDGTAIKFLDPVFFDKFDAYSDQDLETFFTKVVEKLGDSVYTYETFTQDGDYFDLTREGGRDRQQIWDKNGLAGRPDLQRGAVDQLYQPVWEVYQRYTNQLGYTPENQESPHQELTTFYQGSQQPQEALHQDPKDLSESFYNDIVENFDDYVERYKALPDSWGGKMVSGDVAKELSPEYVADRTLAGVVHKGASYFSKRYLEQRLSEPLAEGESDVVIISAGGTGAGKTTILEGSEMAPAVKKSHIIYDTNLADYEVGKRMIDMILDKEHGRPHQVQIMMVVRDPNEALKGAMERATAMETQQGSGRTLPLHAHVGTHKGSVEVVPMLDEHYKDNPLVFETIVYNNNLGLGKAARANMEYLRQIDYNELDDVSHQIVKEEYEKGNISAAIYEGFTQAPPEPESVHRRSRQTGTTGFEQLRETEEGWQPLLGTPGDGLNAPNKRGQIQFTPEGSLITLLENADLSTFLHESGHHFFEVYKTLALENDAIRADMDVLLQFIGVPDLNTWNNMTLEQRRAGHEKVAQAFERYLFEGKAPSLEMQSLFDTFKSWLLQVYKSLTSFNVPLTDDVRQVFDRMLAAEEMIRSKEVADNYQAMFRDQDEAGLTEKQWQEYQNLDEAQRRASVSALERRSLNDLKWVNNKIAALVRASERDIQDKRKAMKEDVTLELETSPVYRAINFVKTGEFTDLDGNPQKIAKHKLDRDDFKLLFPNYDLPRGWTEAGGIPIDEMLAQQFGYETGPEMVKAMLNAAPLKEQIERTTDQRMLEAYGDLMDPVKIHQAAEEAVHSDAHTRMLHTELNALSKRTGVKNLLHKAAKALAERTIGEKKINRIKSWEYSRQEKRAARESERAHRKGDRESAAEHKRAQILANHFWRAARNAEQKVESTVKYLKKFEKPGTRKNLDPEYRDQIDAILENVGLKRISQKEVERRKSFAQWYKEHEAEGVEVPSDYIERLKTHYTEMTYEELMGLRDNVKNIEHLGRLKHKIIVNRQVRDYNETMDEAHAVALQQNPQKYDPTDRAPKRFRRARALFSKLRASLIKVEFLASQLDGDKDNGPWWNLLFRPLADAEDLELRMQAEVQERLGEILKSDSFKHLGRKIYINQKAGHYDWNQVFSMALNWGNEGNRQALVEGLKDQQVSEEDVQRILNENLTENDWNTVQQIWDLIDSYWPQIADLQSRLTGVIPEKVERSPVETPFGEISGGYYPLVYDTDLSYRAFTRDQKLTVQELLETNFLRPTTRKGHTIERVGSAGQAVKLDIGVVAQHINNVIHDLSFREAILQTDKVIQDRRTADAVERVAGKEAYRMLRPWLAGVANSHRPIVDPWEVGAKYLRKNATIVNMGFKLTTAVVQPLGYTQSIDLLGEKWAMHGLAQFYGNPLKAKALTEEVLEKSTFMKNRMGTFDRDINDSIRRLKKESGPLTTVQQWAFKHIGFLDMSIAIPTWKAGYDKALAEGLSEKDAIAQGDKAVRMSQSAGSAKDLARVQGGSEYLRLLTMFYSYFSSMYNMMRRRRNISGRDPASMAKVARNTMSFLYLVALPAVLSELIVGRGPDDEDDEDFYGWMAKEVLAYPLMSVVGIRDITNSVVRGYGYEITPIAQGIESMVKGGEGALNVAMGEAEEKDFKNMLMASGYMFGLPSRQLWTLIDNTKALVEGDELTPPELIMLREQRE